MARKTIPISVKRNSAGCVTYAVSMREYHLSGASSARGLGFTITDVAVFMRAIHYVTKALLGLASGLASFSIFRRALLIVRMLIDNLRGVQVSLLNHCHQLLFHLPVVIPLRGIAFGAEDSVGCPPYNDSITAHFTSFYNGNRFYLPTVSQLIHSF